MKKVYLLVIVAFSLARSEAQPDTWTWVSGDSTSNVRGVYGTKGTPSPTNKPGARSEAISWTDAAGNMWLLGGYSNWTPVSGDYNDLWKFNPVAQQWTWVSGDSTMNRFGVYGTVGVASAANKPGARSSAASWTDVTGNLWLFGGYGYAARGAAGGLNDLWKYSPSTNQWTWIKGDSVINTGGTYGVRGTALTTNKPGARDAGMSWTDNAGGLWMFGGFNDVQSTQGYLDDLWKYDIATNVWTWVNGDTAVNQPGVYGTTAVPSAANHPGSRRKACSWKDSSGNFWLFGGYGFPSVPTSGKLNDLWKYDVATNQWTWMKGDSAAVSSYGIYGTLGVGSASNTPGERRFAVSWTDKAGNLWLLGGNGLGEFAPDSMSLVQGDLNDLWMYDIVHNEWIWMKGDKKTLVKEVYGTKGMASADNKPGARENSAGWVDTSGNLWLFGGYHWYSPNGYLNDLWKYQPAYDYNTLWVTAFLDQNNDGIKETSERWFGNAGTMISKQWGDTILAQSPTGIFRVRADTGTYFTRIYRVHPYYNIVPAMHTTSHATYFNTDSVSFAMQPIPGFKDLSVAIVPISSLRLGRPALYKVLCFNSGTEPLNGAFSFTRDNRFVYDSASITPTSISGNTLTWNFTSLAPLDTISVTMYLKVQMPPVVFRGDTLICTVSVPPVAGESNIQDNNASVAVRVVGSYDPNNKSETHGGKITMTQVNSGDYLIYTVNFQNTGTDTAFNVFVYDTLSSKLDWNTLQMLTASANYQMIMSEGKCQWIFAGINLIDSNHNERASHGYLVFRIKPQSNVQVGDVITNRASIYFDYNLPVRTNIDTTIVVAGVLPLRLLSFTAKKDGNVNKLQWSTISELNVDRFEVERSAGGREYNRIGVVRATNNSLLTTHNYSFPDISPITRNYYRLKIIDKDGRFEYGPIRVVNNNGSFYVSVYPNPAKDKLQVNVESDEKASMQVQVVGQDGKVLLSITWNVNEGTAVKTINTSALQSGSYFLRITSAGKEQSVVKFEVAR